ncbi:MAG: hypothetical protein RJA99_1896 [Pseudomonadota bacterium]|jgi:c-di-GMP-binding flagellar brake protein YcgR
MDAHDYDRIRVEDGAEVLELLRRSAGSRALWSVRASGRPETYLTPLRELSDDGAPVLDPPRAPVIERALVPGSVAAIDLRLPECRVSFESRVSRIGPAGGRPVLRLERPASVLRVQKREAFRVQLPPSLDLRLTLDASDAALVALPLHDLSIHGAAVIAIGARDRFWVGRVFEVASLSLPDGTDWALSARVVHAGVIRRVASAGELRVGLQFVNAPEGLESAIAGIVARIARGLAT